MAVCVQAAGIRQGAGGFWDEFSLDTLVEAGLPEHLDQVHLAICSQTQLMRCVSLACCRPHQPCILAAKLTTIQGGLPVGTCGCCACLLSQGDTWGLRWSHPNWLTLHRWRRSANRRPMKARYSRISRPCGGAWEQLTVVVTFDGEDLIIENLPELQVWHASVCRLSPFAKHLPDILRSIKCAASLNTLLAVGPLWVCPALLPGTAMILLSWKPAAFSLSLPTTTKAAAVRPMELQVKYRWQTCILTLSHAQAVAAPPADT